MYEGEWLQIEVVNSRLRTQIYPNMNKTSKKKKSLFATIKEFGQVKIYMYGSSLVQSSQLVLL